MSNIILVGQIQNIIVDYYYFIKYEKIYNIMHPKNNGDRHNLLLLYVKCQLGFFFLGLQIEKLTKRKLVKL